jgi:exopolyphosphatase/guanosine-5'-triphosphate,3'-diphosphate pyrophosphatase
MDLPGFSKGDQLELAALVRAHRRKFPLEDGDYPPHALKLAVLLRLAVLLHRNRANTALPHVALRAAGDKPLLKFPRGWLKRHPLTRLDLNQEAEYLSAVGVELSVDEDEDAARSIAG